MEWETMSTLDWVNLVNKLACILGEPPEVRLWRCLIFSPGKWSPLDSVLASAGIAKSQDPGKEAVTSLSTSGGLSLLASLPKAFLIPMAALRNYRSSPQFPLFVGLEKLFNKLGIHLSVLWTPELSANPAAMKWPLLQVIHSPDSGDFKPLRRFLSLNPCLFI